MSDLKCITVANTAIPLSDKVKILGVTLDSNLTMGLHTKALSKSCFYHIRPFRQIRSSLDDAMVVSVASVLILSRLNQMNSILYGTALKTYRPSSASPACGGQSRVKPALPSSILF